MGNTSSHQVASVNNIFKSDMHHGRRFVSETDGPIAESRCRFVTPRGPGPGTNIPNFPTELLLFKFRTCHRQTLISSNLAASVIGRPRKRTEGFL